MPTDTVPQTTCPTCGAKITRPELSLCSYCGAPVPTGAASKPGESAAADSALAQRLAKMSEHADFPTAMAWTPPAGAESRAGRALRKSGLVLLMLGLFVALPRLLSSGLGSALGIVLLVASAALIGLGLSKIARGSGAMARAGRLPVMKRASIVTDRTSKTSLARGTPTTYSFSLDFGDGSGGEFEFHGRGTHYDLMTSGTTGIAYTQGQEILEFKRIRV